MAISVSWPTKVINVPKADLTHISGDTYELDIDEFRLALKDLEDDPEGVPFVRTHLHNTEVTVAGLTLARVIQIINGYTITFEDGQYAVNLVGANSNLGDVINLNQVSVRSFNSAGLITYTTGSGLSSEQAQQLSDINDGVNNLESDVGDMDTKVDELGIDTSIIDDKVTQIHERFALDVSKPVTHSEDGISSTNIDIDITDNQDGTFTEQRQ